MSTTNLQFRVSQTQNAAPRTPTFVQNLESALNGGQATYDFFSGSLGALQALAQASHQGGADAWTQVPKASALNMDFLNPDLPAAYIQAGGATMVTQVHASADSLGESTNDYKQAGVATTYVVTSEGTTDVIISDIEKIGPAVASVALTPAITAILGAVKVFMQSFLTRVVNLASGGATDAEVAGTEAAEGAAEDAAVDGEAISEGVTASITFGPLAVAGIVVAAIVLIVVVILFFLAKEMTCFVRVYNFTSQPLQFSLCHGHDLEIQQIPKSPLIPAVGIPQAPPGVTALNQVIYRADYTFLNRSEVKGIGAVFHATSDAAPKPGEAMFPGITAMLDIPSDGDNSMWGDMNGNLNCHSIYNEFSGKCKTLNYPTDQGSFRLTIATNQLDGKSPSPVDHKKGYFYEYLIVIQEEGFGLDVL